MPALLTIGKESAFLCKPWSWSYDSRGGFLIVELQLCGRKVQTKYDWGPAMPGAVVTLSILEVGPVLELIWPSRLRHAPPPWIEVPARYLDSHTSYGAGEGPRISKGF